MKILLRLSDADRAEFKCEEWLEVDPYTVTAREAAVMQRPFFPEHPGYVDPGEWRQALRGTPLIDEHGAPVMVDDGAGGTVQKRREDYAANTALVWLCLRRAGVPVELADLDYDADHVLIAFHLDEPASQGKDDSGPATTSAD